MNRNPIFRSLIPNKIPKRLWESKDYSTIILYALEILGPIFQQEFVNRDRISNKIPEKTFYNHIKRLKTQGYLEFSIDAGTRRNKYMITPVGENSLKQRLKKSEKKYGDLHSKIKDFKYFEKKRIFTEHYTKYINILEKIKTNFIEKITDLTQFYPKEVLSKYPEIAKKLKDEKALKKGIPQTFSQFLKDLIKYKEKIESDILDCEKHIFESEESDKFQFTCPRCKDKYIIIYENTFECVICGSEFEKVDFKLLEDLDDILSIEEKKRIYQNLEKDE